MPNQVSSSIPLTRPDFILSCGVPYKNWKAIARILIRLNKPKTPLTAVSVKPLLKLGFRKLSYKHGTAKVYFHPKYNLIFKYGGTRCGRIPKRALPSIYTRKFSLQPKAKILSTSQFDVFLALSTDEFGDDPHRNNICLWDDNVYALDW